MDREHIPGAELNGHIGQLDARGQTPSVQSDRFKTPRGTHMAKDADTGTYGVKDLDTGTYTYLGLTEGHAKAGIYRTCTYRDPDTMGTHAAKDPSKGACALRTA